MSERTYWRHDDGTVRYFNTTLAALALGFDPAWRRVHVLTDEELAARDAEALRGVLDSYETEKWSLRQVSEQLRRRIEAGGRDE